MKAALENGITGGFLSHTLLICDETEMTIAKAKKYCVSVSVWGEAAADTESAKMYVYGHTKPFHGAECRIKRKITAY